MNPKQDSLADRIRICAHLVGSGDELARKAGLARRTLENYLNGREPQASRLLAIAKAAGVSLDWLVGGDGEMSPPQPAQSSSEMVASQPAQPLDEELMGRITDAISRLYKDERVSLAPIDLGRLAARKYGEVVAATDDPAERLAMLKLITVQLRTELHAAAAEPGTGKRSAS